MKVLARLQDLQRPMLFLQRMPPHWRQGVLARQVQGQLQIGAKWLRQEAPFPPSARQPVPGVPLPHPWAVMVVAVAGLARL
jgi:hypothetical protein